MRWERGEGGAPEEASNMISLVVGLSRGSKETYRNGIQLGCHGLGAWLEHQEVEERELLEDEEQMIEGIIKNKTINRAGGLYKIGVHIANCRIILEVARRVEERAEMKKKEKETEGEGQIGK